MTDIGSVTSILTGKYLYRCHVGGQQPVQAENILCRSKHKKTKMQNATADLADIALDLCMRSKALGNKLV